jgi:hypothetical protein
VHTLLNGGKKVFGRRDVFLSNPAQECARGNQAGASPQPGSLWHVHFKLMNITPEIVIKHLLYTKYIFDSYK